MKTSQLKRWKLKQKKFNRKYKLKSFKKSSSSANYSGKYLFLISSKNLCTVLKFSTKYSCETVTALVVDDYFSKQMSKRLFVKSKRNKKFFKKCKVKVTTKYKEEVQRIIKMSESISSQSTKKPLKKITPIKILSCKFCDEKFTNLTYLDRHYQNLHKLESENDTDEDMTEKEIDEIFQNPCNVPIEPKIVINDFDMSFNSIKDECDINGSSSSTTASNHPWSVKFLREEDKKIFVCRICSYRVNSRGFLNRHMLGLHIPNVFKCYKCKVVYEHKQKLINHLKLAHKQYENEAEFQLTICDPEACGTYHCSLCKYSSLNRENVVEHMLGEHYDEFELENPEEKRQSSSPDSLEELLLPENRAKLLGFKESVSPVKKRVAYPFRCARCKRRFSTKYWLKDHVCIERLPTALDPPTKIQKSIVNGFYHCPYPKCSQVYTDKMLYDIHLVTDHAK